MYTNGSQLSSQRLNCSPEVGKHTHTQYGDALQRRLPKASQEGRYGARGSDVVVGDGIRADRPIEGRIASFGVVHVCEQPVSGSAPTRPLAGDPFR